MKNLLIVAMVLFVVCSVRAQDDRRVQSPNFGHADSHAAEVDEQGTRLSPMAALLRSDLERLGRQVRRKDTALIERYNLVRQCNRYYVQAFVFPADNVSERDLKRYGVLCNGFAPQGCTALIPTRRFVKLVKSGRLVRIDVSAPLQKRIIR
ncbi:MAG: hypothetical protein K5650_05135 [Bacteroidales bacterium]|nr:hypothetical protein [Bacteroidales bacterium]